MCGIAGIFNFQKDEQVDPGLLTKMANAIRHRGPDDEGFFIDRENRVGLAHRRLSIIDLSGGHQPMANAKKDIHIVFNGEIYNFPELRFELESRGCVFSTRSDTEVILYLYETYGEQAFARLNGIFAFAIFDKAKRKLILARDHFGVKPLYYTFQNGRFLFASEMKALFQDARVEKELDTQALDTFLTFRYNPSPQTLFRNVHKLYPGYCLTVNFEGGFHSQSFFESVPRIQKKITEKDAIHEYQRLLENAVKRQLLSDVPVGLFLSGGVDSAVLGHLMKKAGNRKFKTFTIGFAGAGDYNELADAKASARFLESDHEEILLSKEDYMSFFFKSFVSLEEPIAETTVSALYHVSRAAAKHVKVVLAGQGADEPMAGYHRYLGAHFISRYSGILKALPLQSLVKILPRNERLKRAAYVSQFSNEIERLLAIYTIFTPEHKRALYGPAMSGFLGRTDEAVLARLYAPVKDLPDTLAKILYMDTRMSLSDNLLLFNDKITMANALEMRVPFLDLELVQFLESLPSSFKLRGSQRKYIHKKAAEAWLPKEIIYRKKRGFMTPMDEWLQNDLADKTRDLLSDSKSAARRYFNLGAVNNMIQLHKSRRENYQRQIFALLSFEIWHKTFFENKTIGGEF